MLLDLLDGALADRAQHRALDGLSFRQLHDGAARVAHAFSERGVRAGDRVAIYSENRHGFVFAYLAALRLGAIAVPVNVLYRSSDLAHVLHDCTPALVMCSTASAPFVRDADTGTACIVSAGDVEAWADDTTAPAHRARLRIDPNDGALIVYTSGTTGASKGALLSHGALAAIATQLMGAWRWRSDDALLLTLPLFHVHGLLAGLTTSLVAGSRVLLRERFDATAALETISSGEVSMFFGVPTMYVRLLERVGHDDALPPLRLYVSGSAALPADVHAAFERRFHAAILERYGATEFGFALSNRYAGPRIAGSVGIPLPGVRVRIAAAGGAEPLAPGDVGELLVSGPNVFSGYWGRPEATEAAFVVDAGGTRWYRSGDLAQYDAGGDVYRIVGRIKEVIISGGFNVYPREVEDEIERFAGVRACAVIGKTDAVRGELPVAFVETDGSIDVTALLDALRERLASFKIPKSVEIIAELPRNAMGKLDKPALRRMMLER